MLFLWEGALSQCRQAPKVLACRACTRARVHEHKDKIEMIGMYAFQTGSESTNFRIHYRTEFTSYRPLFIQSLF